MLTIIHSLLSHDTGCFKRLTWPSLLPSAHPYEEPAYLVVKLEDF